MPKDTLVKIDNALFEVTGFLGELAADFTPLKDSKYRECYEQISTLQIELVKSVRTLQSKLEHHNATFESKISNKCKFHVSWVGYCNQDTNNNDFCEEHSPLKCSGCGAKATKDCEATLGPMTCGKPLCNNCNHKNH